MNADKTVRPMLDLYLLVGQSNMAGRGDINDKFKAQEDDHVLMLNKEGQWVKAKHPLHFDKPEVAGVGPGLSFGMEMAKISSNKIGLIPCAVGGTSIDQWVPGGYYKNNNSHPYDDAIARLKTALGSGQLKGVIWLQGEANSNDEEIKIYINKLATLIHRLRSCVNNDNLPFVAGEIGRFKQSYIHFNSELRVLPQKVINTAVVTSENLKDKGDSIHFNAASADEYGKRFAAAMKTLLKNSEKKFAVNRKRF